MNLSSSTLKNRAKIKLQGMYGQSLVVTLIYSLIISFCSGGSIVSSVTNAFRISSQAFESMEGGYGEVFSPVNFNVSITPFSSIGAIALFLLAGPLMVGMAHYFLHLADRNNPQINDLFGHFKNFGNTFVLYLLTTIFTFLWSLLFLIPGLIAGISDAMAPYILAEHPEIKASDAIKMSKDMMRGHKGEYFVLQLSFIGWYLLCILTLGIGLFFLSPYVSAAQAEFFNEVSGKNTEKRNMGIDPDGAAPAPGGYPAYGQPQQNNGYNGYSQPQDNGNTGYNGYTAPQDNGNTGYTGYSSPENPPYGGQNGEWHGSNG